MPEIAIRVESLGKQYRIGAIREPYKTLRDSITGAAQWPVRATRSLFSHNGRLAAKVNTIWALKDVSFEIKRGEIVGVIGNNGSGKSTLLKILSRITDPTAGRAEIYGRIGSLLEVGTGFHPELTGRENIYLNGALLGMKKSEIVRHFDAIVAFAEIGQFLETAVKHYSSGMYMRLAFAVAAHLPADILLVDEVLAVGDAAFQRKCLSKMGEVATQGRTVLFVSHDMTNIAVLCRTAILLNSGAVQAIGASRAVTEQYFREFGCGEREARWNPEVAPGGNTVKITCVRVLDEDGDTGPLILSRSVVLSIEYTVAQLARLNPVFAVKNALGVVVFSTANYEDPEWGHCPHSLGLFEARCIVPAHLFNSGAYSVDAMVVMDSRHVKAAVRSAVAFEVHDDGASRGDYAGDWVGVVRPRCIWKTTPVGATFAPEVEV
jgi:lipopolysaccharide transport system ATP-binding protein